MEQEYDNSVHQARIFTMLAILFLLAWSGGAIKNFKAWVAGETNASPTPVPVVSRVYYQTPTDLQHLCMDLDVQEVHDEAGYIIARLPHDQMVSLLDRGFRVEPVSQPTPTPKPTGP